MDSQAYDFLLTAAEVAVAFIGFASLIGVFISRGSGRLPEEVRFALWSLLDYGLLALLACALPIVLHTVGFGGEHPWALASGIMGMVVFLYPLLFARQEYGDAVRHAAGRRPILVWIAIGGDTTVGLLLLSSAFGWPLTASFGIYFCAGVVWNLFGSALSFRGLMKLAWSAETWHQE